MAGRSGVDSNEVAPAGGGLLTGPPRAAASAGRRSILAGAIGNLLEWYDFAIYGYFSAVIAQNFFPSDNRTTSLLAAFAVFAAAFFMRPIGGVVFGHIGDRYGRKTALVLSAGLMTLSTFAIGCLPTYESVGILAPVLLVLLRLGQGLSVGGEYTASVVFLAEGAAPRRRGLIGSLACIGASSGIMMGSLLGTIVTSLLTPDEVHDWGWRIPFLLGIGLGIAIFVLRRHMEDAHREAPLAGDAALPDDRSPFRWAIENDGRAMLRAFAANLSLAAAFYIVFVYLVTYMHRQGVSQDTAFLINTLAMAVHTLSIPVMGALSDRVGRKAMLVAGAGAMALLSWPLFLLIASGDPVLMLAGQVGFALIISSYATALPTALVEGFRDRSRCTALAISYNASMALVGGTAPMVATWIVHALQFDTGPGLYIAILSLVSLGAVLTMRDASGRPLGSPAGARTA